MNESNRIIERYNLSHIESDSQDKNNNETTKSIQPQILQSDDQNDSVSQQRSYNEKNDDGGRNKRVDESLGDNIGRKRAKMKSEEITDLLRKELRMLKKWWTK